MKVTKFKGFECFHRLIPSNHSSPALEGLYDDLREQKILAEIEGVTNSRLKAQSNNHIFDISPNELVAGVPYASIVNAAFCYPGIRGGRFNDENRGAWYSSLSIETCIHESAHRHRAYLDEAGLVQDEVTRDDWLASFTGVFGDMRGQHSHTALGKNDMISYPAGQRLARQYRNKGGRGIIYPSVRHTGGTNLVCFIPAEVHSPQKGETIKFIFSRKGFTFESVRSTAD